MALRAEVEELFEPFQGCWNLPHLKDAGILILVKGDKPVRDQADAFLEGDDETRARMRRELKIVPKVEPSAPRVTTETRPYKITSKEWSYIHSLHRAGVSKREIAARLKVSRPTVDRALARSTPWVPIDDLKKRRLRNLTKHLEQWALSAKMICLGREVPPEQWVEVMKNPCSDAEHEAFIDFVYHLYVCKKVPRPKIASMLETLEVEVSTALASRGIVPGSR